ncbi:MAG: hypothetical protein ACRDKW_17940, partial [Actinomycetota bacterium]
DAFVLFPEGKDFTPRLRERAIASLRRRGHEEEAQQAEAMERVLPPRSTGVMAAVRAAPQADVVFVAHTVLEDVGSLRDLRRRGPLDRPILSRYWRIPAAEVPREEEDLVRWLYGWWAHIDGWIDARVEGREWVPGMRSVREAPPASAEAPALQAGTGASGEPLEEPDAPTVGGAP